MDENDYKEHCLKKFETNPLGKRLDIEALNASVFTQSEIPVLNSLDDTASILPDERNHSIVKEADKTLFGPPPRDYGFLYIGCQDGMLKQYSTEEKRISYNYGKIMSDNIWSCVTTANKTNLFVSDFSGNLKQIDLNTHQVIKDYGKIHNCIKVIVVDKNEEYLFTSNFNEPSMKQWSIAKQMMVKAYTNIFKDKGVSSMVVTHDNKWLFVGGKTGHLLQFDIENQCVTKDYENI